MMMIENRGSIAYWIVVACVLVSGCAVAGPQHGENPNSFTQTISNHKVTEAIAMMNAGHLDEALARVTEAINENPRDSVAYETRGDFHEKKYNFERAIADYSQAIVVTENDRYRAYYYKQRGDARFLAERYDEALADYNQAFERGLSHPHALSNRARILLQKGRAQDALMDITRAIEIDPNPVWYYGVRGDILVELARYQEAQADFERYVSGGGEYERFLTRQGLAWFKAGQREQAKTNIHRLIEMDPRLAANFGGERALDLYDAEKRRTMVKQALSTAESDEAGGRWHEAFQQYDVARTWVSRVDEPKQFVAIKNAMIRVYPKLRTKPELSEPARRLSVQAASAANQKRYKDATSLYDKAFSIAPWWPDAHFNRALLLAQQSRYQEAITEMQHYLTLSPNGSDVRAAQDKIYEWEGEVK